MALALVGLFRGLVALAEPASPGSVTRNVVGIVCNFAMLALGATTAFFATMAFSRGRQIRRRGRLLLPRVTAGGDWASSGAPLDAVDVAMRAPLAAQWRENGKTEHASVAAFARLTLDLVGLGAPPALVAAANRDALDEIRHTELCFALARSLDGRAESPAAFPEAATARALPRTRALALARLAVDSLIDGALHEGVSARIVAKLARRCEVEAIRVVLEEIAADEGRHAAHGWQVVRWCHAQGGEAVLAALRGALGALPERMRSPLPDGARDASWERYGVHGDALEAEEYARACGVLRRRVEALGSVVDANAA
jgi:hypothetical protein